MVARRMRLGKRSGNKSLFLARGTFSLPGNSTALTTGLVGGPYPSVVTARGLQSKWDLQTNCGPRVGHTLTQLTTSNMTSLLGPSAGRWTTRTSPPRLEFLNTAGMVINDINFSGWRVFVNGSPDIVFNDCKFQGIGLDLLITVGATSGQTNTTGANATFNYCEVDGTGQTDLFANTVYPCMVGNTSTWFRCKVHSSPRTHFMPFGTVFITDCYWKSWGMRSNPKDSNGNQVHCNGIHQGSGQLTIDGLLCDMRDSGGGATQPATVTAAVFHEGFQAAITKGIVRNSIFVGTKKFGAVPPATTGDMFYVFRNQDYTYGSTGIQWFNNIIEAGVGGNHILDTAGPMDHSTGDRRYDNFDFDTGARITTPNDPAEITP